MSTRDFIASLFQGNLWPDDLLGAALCMLAVAILVFGVLG